MNMFATVTFACLLATTLVQGAPSQCSESEIMLLLDVSENGRFASSLSWNAKDFRFMKASITEFLGDVPQGVIVGAYSYSSSVEEGAIIPEGSSAEQALQYIDLIGAGENGGSWTDRGLKKITGRPRFENNLLVVVSSQGSAGNPVRMQEAKNEADRLRQLGWNLRVIGVQGRNKMDVEELEYVNGGKKFAVLDDESGADPKSYKLLGKELKKLLKEMCSK